ncbi:MAG: portal protein, partial [Acholeplasmataceae bacterium]
RAPRDQVCEDTARYCLPEQSSVAATTPSTDSVEGEVDRPLDAIGTICAQKLASGLFSNSISLEREWFAYSTVDEKLGRQRSVAEWLHEASRIAWQALRAGNFQSVIQEALIAYPVFGRAVVFERFDDEARRIVFQQFAPADVWFSETSEQEIDRVYRRFFLTSEAAYARYGTAASETIRREADGEQALTRHEFVHVVEPREVRDRNRQDNLNMKLAGYEVDVEARQVCLEDGYEVMPYQIPRFWRWHDRYGTGPAEAALPDLREIQTACFDLSHAVEMTTLPPLFVPDSESSRNIDLRPGAVNYYDPAGGAPSEYKSGADVRQTVGYIEAKKAQVREQFLVDLFAILEDRAGNMTATEVVERVRNRIQSITPVVSRLKTELFEPALLRVLHLLRRAGAFPELPAELAGQAVEVAYSSPMEGRLRQLVIAAQMEGLQQAANVLALEQLSPSVGAYFDLGKVVRAIAHAHNVPPDVIRGEREAAKLLAEAGARAQEQAAAERAGKAVKPLDLNAPVSPDSPLGMLGRNPQALQAALQNGGPFHG